jgi:redox-sensitive bicupin YhaK (pirin superfamily)
MITVRRARQRYTDPIRAGQAGLVPVPIRTESLVDSFGPILSLHEEPLPPGASLPPLETESLTLLLQGTLSLREPDGRRKLIRAGSCLHMVPAGARQPRLRNASKDAPARVFRVSIGPSDPAGSPGCQWKLFTMGERRGRLCLIASPDAREGSLSLAPDALVFWSIVQRGQHLFHALTPGRGAWLQVIQGRVTLDDIILNAGDGAAFEGEPALSFTALEDTTTLLFDVGEVRPAAAALGHGTGFGPGPARVEGAAVFEILWNTLTDVLGPAGAATVLLRAARRAEARHPELGELVITRAGHEYRYALPASFHRAGGDQLPLRHLLDEVRTLLTDLTGQVVLCSFDRVPELQGWVA